MNREICLFHGRSTSPLWSRYKKYVLLDPLGMVKQTRASNEEQPTGLPDAPTTIREQEELNKQTADNYFFVPDMGDVPEIAVPDFLPDLLGGYYIAGGRPTTTSSCPTWETCPRSPCPTSCPICWVGIISQADGRQLLLRARHRRRARDRRARLPARSVGWVLYRRRTADSYFFVPDMGTCQIAVPNFLPVLHAAISSCCSIEWPAPVREWLFFDDVTACSCALKTY